MATAPSPNDLTRQQLDELDALLQRMLSVPLAPVDTPMPTSAPMPPLPTPVSMPTPPAPTSWRVDPPAPVTTAPSPHLVYPEPPSSVSLKFAEPLPEPEPEPAPPPPPQRTAKAVPPEKPAAPPIKPVAVAPVTQLTPAPLSASPPVPFVFLPFVGLNLLFDSICGMFGPVGRLLRSGFFKHIYGLAGFLLLLYTAAHVAQVHGWVTLPILLPWPK
jgi:hypothetical protein